MNIAGNSKNPLEVIWEGGLIYAFDARAYMGGGLIPDRGLIYGM